MRFVPAATSIVILILTATFSPSLHSVASQSPQGDQDDLVTHLMIYRCEVYCAEKNEVRTFEGYGGDCDEARNNSGAPDYIANCGGFAIESNTECVNHGEHAPAKHRNQRELLHRHGRWRAYRAYQTAGDTAMNATEHSAVVPYFVPEGVAGAALSNLEEDARSRAEKLLLAFTAEHAWRSRVRFHRQHLDRTRHYCASGFGRNDSTASRTITEEEILETSSSESKAVAKRDNQAGPGKRFETIVMKTIHRIRKETVFGFSAKAETYAEQQGGGRRTKITVTAKGVDQRQAREKARLRVLRILHDQNLVGPVNITITDLAE